MMHSTPNCQLNRNTRDDRAGRFEARARRGLARNGFARGLLVAATTVALALCPQGVFAQHGGGGGHAGGGGHFGGGGGHNSGGSFGGGSRGSVVASGAHPGRTGSAGAAKPSGWPGNFSHGNPPVVSHSGPPLSSVRPAGPAAGFAAGEVTPAPQHVTLGFPPESAGHGIVATGAGATAGAEGREPASPIVGRQGGVLSFSGQGHEIWQNGLQTAGRGAGGSVESKPLEGQRPRPVGPHRFYGGFGPGYGYGYGYGFGGFYPWGFGWGWGGGLGFGFGYDCDPLWNFGCGGYGYSGYGYYGPYEPSAYLYSGDNGEPADASDSSQNEGVYSEQGAAADNSAASANAGAVIYLNDGTSFAVTDYWVADYKLHYVIDGARENVIDLDQIDVQRTVDENAARGVNFTLRPAPDSEQQ